MISNQRKFVETLADTYHLDKESDWQRVTISLFKKNGGQVFSQFSRINTC